MVVLAAAVLFAILAALGTWQLNRLQWKNAMIAQVDTRTKLAPAPAPSPDLWADLNHDDYEYLPVKVTGCFLHDKEAHIYTVLKRGKSAYFGSGFLVMTPLVTDEGWTVMVNRGFVPNKFRDPASRPAGSSPSPVTIEGLFRKNQSRNAFTPQDDLSKNIWYTRDPVKMALNAGIASDRIAPFSIDAFASMTPPDGLPQAGQTRLHFPNNHLQYVLTWYGLALALAGVVFAFVRSRRRQG